MHYTERAQAIVRLGKELQNRGWTLFGYDPGESDAMTDYYRAAHWDGIATHPQYPGVVIGVDVSAELVKRISSKNGWPVFHGTPNGRIWHIERDGQIVDTGVGLEPCVRVGWQQAVEKLTDRIVDAASCRPGRAAPERSSPTTVTVKHERTWTWVYFPDKPNEAIREALKLAFGARWGKHRRAWYITRHVAADEVHRIIASTETNPEIQDTPSTHSQPTTEENMSNHFKPLPKAMVQPAPYREDTSKAAASDIAGYVAGKGSAHEYIPAWMTIPPLYAAENQENPLALIKLFTPDSSWTWYVLEYDGQDTLFTLFVGQETALGYTSLGELRSVRGPLKLPIERDLWFAPTPVTELEEYIEKWGEDGPYHKQSQEAHHQNDESALSIPPELPGGWALEDIRFLLQKLDEGQLVLVADEKLGIPTIHTDFGVEIEHFGYGLMGAKGPEYKLTFDAGGAMDKTPGGKSWSALRLEGNPPYTYDRETVVAHLQAYLPPEDELQTHPVEIPATENSFVPAWQIPLSQFLAVRGDNDPTRSEHKASVQGALLDHLPVPDGILSEYPDLAWWQNTFQQIAPHQCQRDTWAMEYLKAYFILNENSNRLDETILAEGYQKHHSLVQQAITAGESVPAEVLSDYPDLEPRTESTGEGENSILLTYGRNESNQVYFESNRYSVVNPLLLLDGQEYGVGWFWFERNEKDWIQLGDPDSGEGLALGMPSLQASLARAEVVLGVRFQLTGAPAGLPDEYPIFQFKKMATGEQAEALLRAAAALVPEMSGAMVMNAVGDVPPMAALPTTPFPIAGPTRNTVSSNDDGEAEFARWELELTTGQVSKKQSAFNHALHQITRPGALEAALRRINGDGPRRVAIEKRLADLVKTSQPAPVAHPVGD
jgi:hypothetical protein